MHRYTLTVPHTSNDGSYSFAGLHDSIARRLDARFTGHTAHDAIGSWAVGSSASGHEHVRVFAVDTEELSALDFLLSLAADVRRAADQEAVYVTRHAIETWLVTDDRDADGEFIAHRDGLAEGGR